MSWRLTAVGENSAHTWTRPLPPGLLVVLGRQARSAHNQDVPWDGLISREHVWLLATDESVSGRVLTTARNPVQFEGRTTTCFELHAGDTFRIGKTSFRLARA